MMSIPLKVVIPTSGRPELIRRTLDSLVHCAKPDEYGGTWIVENGPACGVKDVVEAYQKDMGFNYMHVAEPGKSGALNAVLETFDDRTLVVFFDDDVRFGHDILQAYAQAASTFPTKTFFGGPTGVDYESQPADWLLEFLPASARGWSWTVPGPVTKAKFLGFNWAAYAEDIRMIAGFDARFGPGEATVATGQEADAQLRLLAAGLVGQYVADAMVWHYVPIQRCSKEFAIRRQRRAAYFHGSRQIISKRDLFEWRKKLLRSSLVSLLSPFRSQADRMRTTIERVQSWSYLQGQRHLRRGELPNESTDRD